MSVHLDRRVEEGAVLSRRVVVHRRIVRKFIGDRVRLIPDGRPRKTNRRIHAAEAVALELDRTEFDRLAIVRQTQSTAVLHLHRRLRHAERRITTSDILSLLDNHALYTKLRQLDIAIHGRTITGNDNLLIRPSRINKVQIALHHPHVIPTGIGFGRLPFQRDKHDLSVTHNARLRLRTLARKKAQIVPHVLAIVDGTEAHHFEIGDAVHHERILLLNRLLPFTYGSAIRANHGIGRQILEDKALRARGDDHRAVQTLDRQSLDRELLRCADLDRRVNHDVVRHGIKLLERNLRRRHHRKIEHVAEVEVARLGEEELRSFRHRSRMICKHLSIRLGIFLARLHAPARERDDVEARRNLELRLRLREREELGLRRIDRRFAINRCSPCNRHGHSLCPRVRVDILDLDRAARPERERVGVGGDNIPLGKVAATRDIRLADRQHRIGKDARTADDLLDRSLELASRAERWCLRRRIAERGADRAVELVDLLEIVAVQRDNRPVDHLHLGNIGLIDIHGRGGIGMTRVDESVNDKRSGAVDFQRPARTELGSRVRPLQGQRMGVHIEHRTGGCARTREHIVESALARVECRIVRQVEGAEQHLPVAVVAIDDDCTQIGVHARALACDVVRPALEHLFHSARKIEARPLLDGHRATVAHLEARNMEHALLDGDRAFDLIGGIDLENAGPLLDDRVARDDVLAAVHHVGERLRLTGRDRPRHRFRPRRRSHRQHGQCTARKSNHLSLHIRISPK